MQQKRDECEDDVKLHWATIHPRAAAAEVAEDAAALAQSQTKSDTGESAMETVADGGVAAETPPTDDRAALHDALFKATAACTFREVTEELRALSAAIVDEFSPGAVEVRRQAAKQKDPEETTLFLMRLEVKRKSLKGEGDEEAEEPSAPEWTNKPTGLSSALDGVWERFRKHTVSRLPKNFDPADAIMEIATDNEEWSE
jgi:hypothetical protein